MIENVDKNEYESLSKLTLIVPTRDRNYYLSRWLWYTAQFPIGKIIIADSSCSKKKEINQSTINAIKRSHPNIDIHYLECEPETDFFGGDIFPKWGLGIKYVPTEYCKMCTDKEFIHIGGMVDCVDFLSNHPEYVAAEGVLYSALSTFSKSIVYKIDYPHRKSEDSPNSLFRYMDAFVSQKKWLSNSLLVAITRTDSLEYLYQLLDSYDISDIRYAEIILGTVGYLIGKCAYLPKSKFSVIDYFLKHNKNYKVNNRIGSQESSASRFISLRLYESYGVYLDFSTKFMKCMKAQLIYFASLTSENADYFIKYNLLPNILSSSMNPHSSKAKYSENHNLIIILEIFREILGLFPIEFQSKINLCMERIFHLSLPVIDSEAHTSFSKIGNYILLTLHMHDTDQPLTEQDFLRTYK